MIIDRVRLKNFRSYTDEEITFSPGVSLFEGDIGSGKSSLLFAVEFALFGPADVPPEHLLRAGATEGSIELSFRAGGSAYTVGRLMKRDKKGTPHQKEAYLIGDGARQDLSVTQLRAAVIQILGFREVADPRTKSQIFRYGVFTPQEEMKAILEQPAEERKQTLRRAFGLEEFKRARENSVLVLQALREIAAKAEGRLQDRERVEQDLKVVDEEAGHAHVQWGEAQAAVAAAALAVEATAKRAAEADALEQADREAERAAGVAAADRGRAEERRAAARREVAEISALEAHVLPLRAVAAALATREERLAAEELKEKAHNQGQEAVRAAKSRIDALSERKAEIQSESEMIRKVLDRSEEVLEGQRQLEAARKALSIALEDHTKVREAKKRLDEADARLAKARRAVERGAAAESEAAAAAPAVAAGEAASAAIGGVEAKRLEAQAAAGATRADLARLEAEWQDLSSLTGKARCPMCKQEVSREHLKEHGEELARDVGEAKRRLAKAQSEVRTLDRSYAQLHQARQEGEVALRKRDALLREAALAREAAEEAAALEQSLVEARELVGRGEEAGKRRAKLEREVQEKAHFDRRAGEMESARKRWRDVSGHLTRVRADHEKAVEDERKAREAVAALTFHAEALAEARRAAREARDAAARLAALEARIGLRGEAERAVRETEGSVKRAEAAAAQAAERRAELARRIEADPPLKARSAHQAALAEKAAALEREKASTESRASHERAAARLRDALASLVDVQARLDGVRHARDFLEQCFQPGMEGVETQVLLDLNEQFNARFQSYFERLMEGGTLDVEIDADFTPLAQQGAQPLPVQALSGGERTSIALAYRLALNVLVSRAAGMETPDLLVLDEPTDGFSKEQLARVGELLREIDCQQVILVSHERELESCADHVFEVIKDGTVSRVVAR